MTSLGRGTGQICALNHDSNVIENCRVSVGAPKNRDIRVSWRSVINRKYADSLERNSVQESVSLGTRGAIEVGMNAQWDKAEASGLVRLRFEPEHENYFDVYGEPEDAEERVELCRVIDTFGLWWCVAEFLSQDDGVWQSAGSIGMLFGNDLDDSNPYITELKAAALANIYAT